MNIPTGCMFLNALGVETSPSIDRIAVSSLNRYIFCLKFSCCVIRYKQLYIRRCNSMF